MRNFAKVSAKSSIGDCLKSVSAIKVGEKNVYNDVNEECREYASSG